MPKCPYCEIHEDNRHDLGKHIKVFHRQEEEAAKQAYARDHAEAYLKHMGFEKELARAKVGLCVVCGKPPRVQEMSKSELKEFFISGACGPCQRKMIQRGGA